VLIESIVDKGMMFVEIHRRTREWCASWLVDRNLTQDPGHLAKAAWILADMMLLSEHFGICGTRLLRLLGLRGHHECWALMCLARLEWYAGGFDPNERETLHAWLLLPTVPPCPAFVPREGTALHHLLKKTPLHDQGLDPDGSSRAGLDDVFLGPLGDAFQDEFEKCLGTPPLLRWLLDTMLRMMPLSEEGTRIVKAALVDAIDDGTVHPNMIKVCDALASTVHREDILAATQSLRLLHEAASLKTLYYDETLVMRPPGLLHANANRARRL
jgi:hypothetical protein